MRSPDEATKARTLPDYVADSYALVALLEGNDRYVRIFRRKDVATTALNVLEVYSTLLRRIPPAEAREVSAGFLSIVVRVPSETAFSAGDFRHSMRAKKRYCSYVDA